LFRLFYKICVLFSVAASQSGCVERDTEQANAECGE